MVKKGIGDLKKHRENKVPTIPNVIVTQDPSCPGQEGRTGDLNKERWCIREGYAGNLEILDMVGI